MALDYVVRNLSTSISTTLCHQDTQSHFHVTCLAFEVT
jgi:hypothetical protein